LEPALADARSPESSTLELEASFAKLIELSNFESFSWRELTLLAHHINPQSPGYRKGARSAELAGFTRTRESLASQASRTLAKAKAGGLLKIILSECGATLEQAGRVLSDCMQARRVHPVIKNGQVVLHDGGADHPVRLQAAKVTLQVYGAFDHATAGDRVKDAAGEGFAAIELPQSPTDDSTSSAAPAAASNPIREAVSRLSAAEYDQTLNLANLVEEAIGLKAEIVEEESKKDDERS
jgi:hypothetical protein